MICSLVTYLNSRLMHAEFIPTHQWDKLMIWQSLNSVSDVDWAVYAIVFDADDINKNEKL